MDKIETVVTKQRKTFKDYRLNPIYRCCAVREELIGMMLQSDRLTW
ncbi:hypothetical protein HMPREF0083_00511 [Aneurinibacillus aneurinilyticus ATCC 12856]|uniref:Uncharacterized protein n=1 Tax=Aneurinibacillus aneurinilyticus ATCC 12856 TaxID=649747 RepID=U1YH01_ANEAE|nr:hypothetical protein HMPREF0083_00511 [Aneurinibacillus aneurinilyticus ATCC 12856]